MLSRLRQRLHVALERRVPEKRLFLRTDTETRFVRLRPSTQLLGWIGSAGIVAWAIVATAVLLMDSIGAGNFREQAKREQAVYEERLNALADQRDARSAEALAAQERFNAALAQISAMQSELLASEDRRKELERGISVVQATLRRTAEERDTARGELKALVADLETNGGAAPEATRAADVERTLAFLSGALADTAIERDTIAGDAAMAVSLAQEMEAELKLMEARNDQIFRRLEDAMTISVEPLDKMFRAAGLPTERLIEQVRQGYSGQGGPITPIAISTKGAGLNPDTARANRILDELDRMALYRIAAERAPFSMPVKDNFRFTSGFGPRWGRMHNGADFAAPTGTDIFSTADGVVIHAGWSSGYGRLIKIQHEFGIETRYAHLSKIRVKVGQRVSRGQHIGDMGNSGRSTGTHLHYEIRVGGKPVNPMIY
ncbi:MAG: M23 family metallopeptidase, partial [Pseudomonadota bacterium]